MRRLLLLAVCLATVATSFAACEKSEDTPINQGTEKDADIVAFTFAGIDGKANIDKVGRTVSATAKETVGLSDLVVEFTLSTGATATVGGTPQVSKTTANNFNDPVTYKVTSGDGETTRDWTVTITKPLPAGKKYITYNKPVKAYLIEYNGGAIAANGNATAGNFGTVGEAYESKKYAYVRWDYDYWQCDVLSDMAKGYFSWDGWSNSSPNEWMEWDDQAGTDAWNDGAWQKKEYPLDGFAFWVSKRKLGNGFLWMNPGGLNDLADVAAHPETATMPDNTDVTQYYLRSEKICGIICDVYKISTVTFWVDPQTGFTLKLESRDDKGNLEESPSYEVTRLVLGKPDWDGEHLHYITGVDKYLRP